MMDFLGSIIAYPFRWINAICPNYVITLLLFAILMKIILFPLGIKQQKNSVKQASLRPYEALIRKKYAGRTDKASQQKLNEEIMDLYQKENFNPMSGCLPLLLQFPILIALYQVIIKPATFLLRFPKELLTKMTEVFNLLVDVKADGITKGATEIIQINKLLDVDKITVEGGALASDIVSKIKDFLGTAVTVKGAETTVQEAFEQLRSSFNLFGINLMEQPSLKFNVLILIPLLVFLFSWGSMKLTKKFTYQPSVGGEQDNATKSSMMLMDITFPLMSAWISFMTPAGIGIYWIIQNVLGVAQQYALSKMYPIPEISPEELKAAERAIKNKGQPQVKKPVYSEPESSAPAAAAQPQKKKAQKTAKPSISAHGRARIKAHGTVPRAIKKPGKR